MARQLGSRKVTKGHPCLLLPVTHSLNSTHQQHSCTHAPLQYAIPHHHTFNLKLFKESDLAKSKHVNHITSGHIEVLKWFIYTYLHVYIYINSKINSQQVFNENLMFTSLSKLGCFACTLVFLFRWLSLIEFCIRTPLLNCFNIVLNKVRQILL